MQLRASGRQARRKRIRAILRRRCRTATCASLPRSRSCLICGVQLMMPNRADWKRCRSLMNSFKCEQNIVPWTVGTSLLCRCNLSLQLSICVTLLCTLARCSSLSKSVRRVCVKYELYSQFLMCSMRLCIHLFAFYRLDFNVFWMKVFICCVHRLESVCVNI